MLPLYKCPPLKHYDMILVFTTSAGEDVTDIANPVIHEHTI